MNKFIHSLIQNDLIRSSQIFKDFITLTQEQFEEMKKVYNQMSPPESMKKYTTMEGILNIYIKEDKEAQVLNISDDIKNKNFLYDQLNTSVKELMRQMDIMSTSFNEVSNSFRNLSLCYKSSINGDYISRSFAKLSILTNEWAKGYQLQRTFFKEEIKEFYKYMKKEVNEFNGLYEHFSIARNNYIEFQGKLSQFLEEPEKIESFKGQFFTARTIYGFILNRLYEEYSRVNKEHARRIKNQLTLINDRKEILLADYSNLHKLIKLTIE